MHPPTLEQLQVAMARRSDLRTQVEQLQADGHAALARFDVELADARAALEERRAAFLAAQQAYDGIFVARRQRETDLRKAIARLEAELRTLPG